MKRGMFISAIVLLAVFVFAACDGGGRNGDGGDAMPEIVGDVYFEILVDNVYSWLEFVTPRQFEVALGHLWQNRDELSFYGIAADEFEFEYWMVQAYIQNVLDPMVMPDLMDAVINPIRDIWVNLRYYDAMDFDGDTDNARRILVRMHEVWMGLLEGHVRYMIANNPEMRDFPPPQRINAQFGRELVIR
ncbi:MAG: hypothetical protein FWB71_00350 [Defluviitaleaceae bacterium]|nr:hypothetical protein [Defluviitaleaceae bacterium]